MHFTAVFRKQTLVYVCMYMLGEYTCVMWIYRDQESTVGIIPQKLSTLFFETESLVGLTFTDEARLPGQCAQGICHVCCCSTGITDVCLHACLFIKKGSGDENQGLLVDAASTLPTEPSPQPCTSNIELRVCPRLVVMLSSVAWQPAETK